VLSTFKGRLSAKLLATKSNQTVSLASVYFAFGLAILIAMLSALFAFAQWQVGENLARMQQARAHAVEERVAISANMGSQQANAHRATLNVLLSRDSKEFEEAEALRRSNLHGYLESSRLLEDSAGLHDAAEELRALTTQYGEISAQVVDIFREGQREAALDLRVSRLRGAFNRWQQAHAGFTIELAQTEAEQKAEHDAATAQSRRWLAGLLIAPLALIVLGVLLIAAVFGLQRFSTKAADAWSR